MNYEPAPVPMEVKDLPEYIQRELRRVAASTRANAERTVYLRPAKDASLSGVFQPTTLNSGTVFRVSASASVNVTGIGLADPCREIAIVNIGTANVYFLDENAGASASYRLAVPATLTLGPKGSITFWYDGSSYRWRAMSRT